MRAQNIALTLGMLAVLAACGSSSGRTDRESSDGDPVAFAKDECEESVDVEMQLRGYPRRPSPETPQYAFRQIIFEKCMRRKGYVPE